MWGRRCWKVLEPHTPTPVHLLQLSPGHRGLSFWSRWEGPALGAGGALRSLSSLCGHLHVPEHSAHHHFLRRPSPPFLFYTFAHFSFLVFPFATQHENRWGTQKWGVFVRMVEHREKGALLMPKPTTRKETQCFYLNSLSPQLSLHVWKKHSQLSPFHTLRKAR